MPRFPKIIVTGGRGYSNKKRVEEILEALNPDTVVQGGATGADLLAYQWAKQNGKTPITVDAEWTKYDLAAGPIRNRKMCADHRDGVLVAFPGNKGTADCIRAAKSLGMTVLIVEDK